MKEKGIEIPPALMLYIHILLRTIIYPFCPCALALIASTSLSNGHCCLLPSYCLHLWHYFTHCYFLNCHSFLLSNETAEALGPIKFVSYLISSYLDRGLTLLYASSLFQYILIYPVPLCLYCLI